MKQLFLNYSISNIKKYYPDYDDIKLDELRYGLEGVYLSITKLFIISLLSIALNVFFEMIIMLVVFNILRSTGFGIHAKRSIDCWISSIIIFLLFPWLSKTIVIPIWLHIALSMIFLTIICLYAPADTIKHPLINKRKRMLYKIITIMNTLILLTFSFFTSKTITNLIIFGVLTEVLLINPLTYKVCGLPYRNYKNYGLNSNV